MGEPHLVVLDDARALARAGADVVAGVVNADGPVTIVPATGETPVGMFEELAARRARGNLDTSGVSIVQLDEYLGLELDDRRALFGWMERTVVEPLAIGAERVARLPTEGDVDAACATFERELDASGGIDLVILGSRSLEGLNLQIDPVHKILIDAGPAPAALAVASAA